MKKKVVVGFLLVFLMMCLGIVVYWLIVEQNRNSQRLDSKIEAFEKRISALEIQPQSLEDVEKIELATKLADANAKLINTEFGKFERELRDSNDKWLFQWTSFFLAIITVTLAIIGVAFWFWVKSLIADRVEKNLNEFKESVDQLDEIKDQLKVLQTGHAVSILEHFRYYHPGEEPRYREQTSLIPEAALLQVLGDETRDIQLRLKAADVLAYKKSPLLVTPLLKFMHSIVNDDLGYNYHDIRDWGCELIKPLGQIHTRESYQGLKEFLKRLRTEDSVYKHLLLTSTVFTLTKVSVELNKSDSVSILRKSIPDLKVTSHQEDALINLVEYFDKFNATEGIKEILKHNLADKMSDVEIRCLELLKPHDPQFVNDWRERKANTNTETEEVS